MWVPKPIYDHAPSFWLLLGVLFLAGGAYLDFSDGLRAAYFVFATFCFSHAAWTFLARRRNRREAEARSMAEAVESTEP
jgi:hypothetical protein